MAEQTNAKKLEARIVQLENALKALTALRKPVDLTADEIKTYLKVRDAIAGDVLGIANCARGAEACVANCGSRGTEACVANCGSRAAPSSRIVLAAPRRAAPPPAEAVATSAILVAAASRGSVIWVVKVAGRAL